MTAPRDGGEPVSSQFVSSQFVLLLASYTFYLPIIRIQNIAIDLVETWVSR